jgi:hypothetical protein
MYRPEDPKSSKEPARSKTHHDGRLIGQRQKDIINHQLTEQLKAPSTEIRS